MPASVDPEYARAIGTAIAEARRLRRLTQDQLGLATGNSKTAVSNWERGASAPTAQNLRELCRALDVPPHRLLVMNDLGRARPTDVASAAGELASDLAAMRDRVERGAPDLIEQLRQAEEGARRLATE